jgi:hypothetical protein
MKTALANNYYYVLGGAASEFCLATRRLSKLQATRLGPWRQKTSGTMQPVQQLVSRRSRTIWQPAAPDN